MEKFRNEKGEVAVLYSPRYGAGWYSWNTDIPECLFDPEIVQMVLDQKPHEEIAKVASTKWPNRYWGGAETLKVVFVPEGTKFLIEEYDGYETIMFQHFIEPTYITA